ncbi:MAG: hypothetical protein ACR2N6_04215 [Miltoncostaeaceae bacterium]
MAFDDDDDPPRLTDPEDIEKARKSLRGMEEVRRRALRWTYLGLAILIVVVIVLAYAR